MTGGAYFPPIEADPHDPEPQGWAGLLVDLIPLLRRVEMLDPDRPVRLRVDLAQEAGGASSVSAFIALPFDVLISRALPWDDAYPAMDRTVGLVPLIDFLLGEGPEPSAQDELWRGGLPPARGWTRLDTLDDEVIRERVRVGATAVRELTDGAADGEQIRQVAIDALLDSVVLTVSAAAGEGNATAPIPLRTLSALTRMGFVRRESTVGVDIARGWIRVAAVFGAAYAVPAARPGAPRTGGLGMLPMAR
ncbi:MAG: hypothetical protein JWN20_2620 [Jatrophihabitantaceae bacterium]|nr:hypothetical protein [Jatrophihabitantaceae bacterium]